MMAYDSARGTIVLFGGRTIGTTAYFSDTWEWNGSNWTQRNPTASPTSRSAPSMVYDSGRGVMVLFGGASASTPYLSDTWEYVRP
jgi:hypothetical protein